MSHSVLKPVLVGSAAVAGGCTLPVAVPATEATQGETSLARPVTPTILDRVLVTVLVALLLGALVLSKLPPAQDDSELRDIPDSPSLSVASLDIHQAPNNQVGEQAVAVPLIADIIAKVSSKLDEAESRRLAHIIVEESARAGYDPLFIASVIKAESTFNQSAISSRGAQGLMQILPTTGQYISKRSQVTWLGAHKLHDPAYNIKLGVAYLKYLERYVGKNREHLLIAYNWGPNNLTSALKRGGSVPATSRKYAEAVLSTHRRWRSTFDQRIAQVRSQVGMAEIG